MKTLILASLLATSALSTEASDIVLSKSIKSKLRTKIERDLNLLSAFKFKGDASLETLKIMNLTSLNAATAEDWLNDRVNYVIEENALSPLKLLLKKAIFVEREGVTFPNANILPHTLSTGHITEEDEGMVVMSNIGAGLYMAGKSESKVYGMKISRGLLRPGLKVLAESPRVGIIQIGEGLFAREVTVNNNNPDALANSINRLGTFFHEARHSDGNAASLGFAHIKCPAGHDMEGAYACDENLNGPYTVGGVMTAEMLKGCNESCTEREKEILKIVILDSQNRIIKTTKTGQPTTDWDANPESL